MTTASSPSNLNNLQTIMARPLIVGASVSADYFTPSPGKRLALRYTTPDQIIVKAGHGRRAEVSLASVTDTLLQDRTVVIGMDLLFWDSFAANPRPALAAFEKFEQKLNRFKIPAVIGEIPEVIPFFQKSVIEINRFVREAARKNPRLLILESHNVLHQVLSDGYINHNGRRYAIHELLPDGLHIGEPASEYFADKISSLFI